MKKMNNKGFSLVELIVVVLIMAIIAVALAPQVMRWVENSRKSNDIETYNTLVTACNTASTDEAVVAQVKGATQTIHYTKNGVSGLTGALETNVKKTIPELAETGGMAKMKVTSSDWSASNADFTITVSWVNGDGIKVARTNPPTKDFS